MEFFCSRQEFGKPGDSNSGSFVRTNSTRNLRKCCQIARAVEKKKYIKKRADSKLGSGAVP